MIRIPLPSFVLLLVSAFVLPVMGADNNILFVGNSFTHGQYQPLMGYNKANVFDTNANGVGSGGVPGVFQKMATDLGYPCKISMEAMSSQNLSFHYEGAQKIIGQPKWQWVVLQDYSTEPTHLTSVDPPRSVEVFDTAVGNLSKLIKKANPRAKVILYETWARPDICNGGDGFPNLQAMFDELHTNYFKVAANHDADVAPVGDAFAKAIANGFAQSHVGTPKPGQFDLWFGDKYHPSVYGGYLAAAVFMGKIAGIDPRTIPTGPGSAAEGLGISSEDATNLNLTAYQTINSPPVITSVDNTSFASGLPGTFAFATTGAPSPTFSASGLPAWATLNPTTGVLSGTPNGTAGSPYSVTVTVSNGATPDGTQNFTLNVTAPTAPKITSSAPTAETIVDKAYTFTYLASGAPAATFSVSTGNLPLGLELSPAGILSGKPIQSGSYTATISAANDVGAATQDVSFNVLEAPAFSNGPPPAEVQVGTAYTSFTYKATGAPTPTFGVASGELPAGMTLTREGVLSGTPSQTGSYTATISAGNGVGSAATQELKIAVQPGPVSHVIVAIDCGSNEPYTGSDGTLYSEDKNFTGGATGTANPNVRDTHDAPLYKTFRTGTFTYAIPVPNGDYFVDLKYCETAGANPGDRKFNVTIQDKPVLTDFDIRAHTVISAALVETFPVTVDNGTLTIVQTDAKAHGFISALVVRTAPPGSMPAPAPTPAAQ